MIKRGKFIVLESIEAAGKGTATDYMRDEFRARKTPVVFTREVGGTPFAEVLRELMLSKVHNVPTESDVLLAYAARIEHTKTLIIPSLEAGKHVFSERYYASSLAYQGSTCKETQAVHDLFKSHLVVPDLTILLDIRPHVSMERMQSTRVAKGVELDKFEVNGEPYFTRVRDAYYAQMDDTWKVVNAEQSIPEVKAHLCAIIDQFLEL